MDFMKNISRADCAYLDSLPRAERDRLWETIIKEQERRKGMITAHELGEILNLGKDSVNALPLKFTKPYRKTTRGMRQVRCVHKDDLIAFLSGLNPSFADFDLAVEWLLTPSQAKDQFGEDLPEYVQLSNRTRRYRPCTMPKALAPSELIMRGL